MRRSVRQHDHRIKTSGELVVVSTDSPALVQSAKHLLNDVPLLVFRAIKPLR